MNQNCKYKGGGLGKSEHKIPYFLKILGAQKNKNVLGSDQNTKKTSGHIIFILECTMIELCDDIEEDLL